MNLRRLLFLKAAIGSGSAQLIERTATGNPVSFSTNVQQSLTQFTIPFTCWQSGSGDPSPSNARPIIGYSAFDIAHFNKNDIVFSATESTANGLSWEVDDDGNVIYAGTPTSYSGINVGIYHVKGGETIHGYLVGDIDNVKFTDAWIYDENWNHIATASSGWTGQKTPQNQGTIDLSEYPDAAYVSISLSGDLDNVAMSGICLPVIGENLSTADLYSIEFPNSQTVYIGEYNAITGVLTLTHAYRKYVGASDEKWYDNSSHTGCFVTGWAEVKNKRVTMCNMSPANNNSGDFPSYGYVHNQNSGYNIRTHLVNEALTVSQFKSWLAEHPLELVCPLIESVSIQLSPIDIQTLNGANMIWTNTNGTNTIKYVKKPTYVDETGYEHENVNKLTFIGNPYAFSPLTVYTKPNVIKLPDFDHTYTNLHMTIHDNIITYDGVGSSTNDLSFNCEDVDIPAGTYYGTIMPHMGDSVFLSSGKNMYVDFWYDGNSGTRDVRVKIEDVKDVQKFFNVTLTSHVYKMCVWAGYGANTYDDYKLFWYMCDGEISSQQVGDPIEDGETSKVTLSGVLPYVYTGQHQTTARVPET